jgi:hypothetical protein
MRASTFLLFAGGIAALLHFVLIPVAQRRWRSDSTPGVIAKAGSVAGLQFVRNAALCAVAAATVALAFVGVAGVAGLLLPKDFTAAAATLAGVHGALSAINERAAFWIVIFLLAGLFYASRRAATRRMRDVYEAATQRELQRLQAELEAGSWEPREPTAEMRPLIEEMAKVRAVLGSSDASDELRARADHYGRELENAWLAMDMRRRMNLQWDDFLAPAPASTRRERVMNVFFSKGTLGLATGGSRWMTRAAMVVLFLSFIGLNATSVAAVVERRWVRLSELQVHERREVALASAANLPAREPDELDRRIAEELARQFEDGFAAMPLFRPAVSHVGSADFALRDLRLRRAILDEFVPVRQGEQGLAQYPSMSDAPTLSPLEREALATYEQVPRAGRGPRTGVGERFQRDILADAHIRRTPAWERMRTAARTQGEAFFTALQARRATFHQAATVHDLAYELTGRLFGDVLNDVAPPSGEYGELLKQMRGEMGEASAQRLYRSTYDQYIADLAGGIDPAEARVVDQATRYRFATSQTEQAIRRSHRVMPSADAVVPRLAEYQPRLRWHDGGNPGAALAAVSEAPTHVPFERRLALTDQLASYDDFFPAQASVLGQTPRSQARTALVTQFRNAGLDGASGQALRRVAAEVGEEAGRRLARMATSASAVSGFFRVGGVVIGQNPSGVLEDAFVDLRWRVDGERMELWLVDSSGGAHALGTFGRGLVHQALGYVADDRRVAATMVATGGDTPLKILLHPALVDTRLGNDVIELDRFVDVLARDPDSGSEVAMRVAAAQYRVQAHDQLYRLAWMARALGSPQLAADERSLVEQELFSLLQQPEFVELTEAALGDTDAMGDGQLSPLTVKPEFYEGELVGLMRACAQQSGSLQDFQGCAARPSTSGTVLVPPPSFEVWSGVREQRFTPDVGLAFLRSRSGSDPFRFLIQAAFTSPPEFARLSEVEMLSYSDSLPWEFPSVQGPIGKEIRRRLASDPERAGVLRRVQDFVLLQRLFRTILVDGLGREFPKERLIALTRDSRAGTAPAVATPRWNAAPGQLEMQMEEFMAQMLSLPGLSPASQAGSGAVSRCTALLRSTLLPETIPASRWNEACDFRALAAQFQADCSDQPNSDMFACGLLALDDLSRSRQIQRALSGT